MDNSYEEFEATLKDLLSWYQKAVTEHTNDEATRRGHVYSTGFVIPSVSTGGIDNARLTIINHCRRYDKTLRQKHGIL